MAKVINYHKARRVIKEKCFGAVWGQKLAKKNADVGNFRQNVQVI